MTITEEFKGIVEREEDATAFLKSLNTEQKKELYPTLKKLQKYYSEYVQQGNTSSWSSRGTRAQTQILSFAAFICFNQKEFEQSISYGIMNRESLTPILPWYCPNWFNAYVDKLSLQEYVGNYFDYDWYLELVEQGYLEINRQMVAKILPELIFPRKEKTWRFEYKPENLLTRAVTLQEHIWYLFEFETNLHGAERYKQFEDNSVPGRWMDAFKRYMEEGKIDRERILKESISCATKNFNQAASNWFMDLFMFLQPGKTELLHFQNELLNTFNSANSKPYNLVLKILKDLVPEPGFSVPSFLDHVPLVLASESKTAVSSALMVLEAIAKKHPNIREQICVTACQAFIHRDNSIQLRAAKLIQKYGQTNSELIKENVQPYYDALFSDVRNVLTDLIGEVANEETSAGDDLTRDQADLVSIEMPRNFDDFVFLASQAFDQNETYHFDLLPASILKFQNEMTADNILKLMPAFQRAYKMITSDWTSSMGYLDNMLAKFFMSFGQLLVSFNSKAAEPISSMHRSFVKLEEERKSKWDGYKMKLGGIKPWDIYTHSSGYKPHKHILLYAFYMLERKVNLPLLSTPTHEPCWVSPMTLIERLSVYQNANALPGDLDIQIAIARCLPGKEAEAIKLANEKLKGEYRELIGLILDEDRHPKDNSKLKSAWLVAGITKFSPNINAEWTSLSGLSDAYLTGEFEWESLVEDYVWQQYDYQLKKNVDVPAKRKIIRVNFGDKQRKTSSLKTVLSKILPNQKEIEPSIYDLTELKFEYISAEHNDIKRFLYLTPRQPSILIAHIINKGLRYIDFTGENDKKLIIYTLETLLNLNYRHGTMSDLLIASCMISSDKTVRTYAAEIWIKGVTENNIDSHEIGKIIGKHEQIELAPLKRFTDLVISNMFQISKKHNQALENLLTACIERMSDSPISGTKKLLEIYAEVLSTNMTGLKNEAVIKRMNVWGNTESLKKVVQKIKGLLN